MSDTSAATTWGFTVGAKFSETFSKVSIEAILFYAAAVAAWAVEKLHDSFKAEVEERIEAIIPHRPKWYADKVSAFQQNCVLPDGSDVYDNNSMTEANVEAAKVVKHVVATEVSDASVLIIKVAGDNGGERCKLSTAVETQLRAYIKAIKDAGVKWQLINADADEYYASVDVYYNAQMLPERVREECEAAIKNYVENLPFNGEYTNMAMIDALQAVDGVEIAEFKFAKSRSATSTDEPEVINARCTPVAGYFTVTSVTLTMIAHE